VITITAYTEPVPATAAVSEPPQTQENEENEEESSFAEILAGMLRNTETSQALDVPLSDFSGQAGVETFAGTENLSLSGNVMESGNNAEDNFDIDLSDAAFSEEYQDTLLSAEHLFTRSAQAIQDADTDDISKEISDAKTKLKPDLSFFMTETAETDAARKAASELAAMQKLEEASNKMDGKKERSAAEVRSSIPSFDKENDGALYAGKKSGEESFNLRSKQEESRGRLDELRSRSRRDRAVFEVRDLRTETTVEGAQTRSFTAVETAVGRAHNGAPVQEITLELRLPNNNSGASQNMAQTSWETGSGSALENLLARELHQSFNGDIVRHASMALRDGGEGTIKIALKPESLGNVKIRLEMTENKITGHIVVESEEAMNAFRKEIASLEQAFRDSGFNSANLNLSLTADGRGAESQEREEGSYAPHTAASRYDDSFEQDALAVDVFFDRRPGSINLFA